MSARRCFICQGLYSFRFPQHKGYHSIRHDEEEKEKEENVKEEEESPGKEVTEANEGEMLA